MVIVVVTLLTCFTNDMHRKTLGTKVASVVHYFRCDSYLTFDK